MPFTLVSSCTVEELTLTLTVVDLPGFFGVVEAGAVLGRGLGVVVEAGGSIGAAAGASVEVGVDPPPVPGVVKSCALGDIPPGAGAMPPPGAEGAMPPPVEGIFIPGAAGVTGVVVVGI